MIRFACPRCEKVYSVPDSAGGRPAACRRCNIRFLIPDPPSVFELDRPAAPTPQTGPPSTLVVEAELVDEPVPSIPPASSSPPPVETEPRLPAEVLDAEVVEADANPPPPPSPSKLAIPRELEPCPRCTAVNSVLSEHVGLPVECPFCKTVYLGVARRPPPPPPPVFFPMPMFGLPTGNRPFWSMPALPPPPPPPPTVVIFSPPPVPPGDRTPVPPPPVENEVDIAPCPHCRAELVVAADAVGGPVECPFCKTVYPAEPPRPKDGTLLAKVVRRNGRPVVPAKKRDKRGARAFGKAEGTDADDLWPKGR